MKVKVMSDERYPTMVIDEDGDDVNVPPSLLRSLEEAQMAVQRAENRILRHLIKTEQTAFLGTAWLVRAEELRRGQG